ncbi:uncharacterized protein LOC101234615 [Hydra vulgaris]|uniref:Uncharacterized protein LOC101234615 n=1 Tax=Hydra vulgaris TaxID=6087 RepID=A0ABM4C5G2_HYDVU
MKSCGLHVFYLTTIFKFILSQLPSNIQSLELEFASVAETYAPERRLLVTTEDDEESLDKKKRILCIGDSITLGYYGVPKHFHPYSYKLRKLLQQQFGDEVEVTSKGVGGERVHKEMYTRLQRELSVKRYDLVIILGGVNDLVTLDCLHTIDLFEEIRALHEIARSQNIKTVAMTILEAHVLVKKIKYMDERSFEAMRMLTNYKIRQMVDDMTSLCDTSLKFPFSSLPWDMQKKLWSTDKVHPTPEGYDILGEIVFDCIKEDIYNL